MATCLKDERVDLLSHDTRGGRKHSRDEDETVAADTPVLNMSTRTHARRATEQYRSYMPFFGPEEFN